MTCIQEEEQTKQQNVLATVDNDVLGHHSALQHALLGVIAAAAKQARRLNLKVADLLLVTVDDAEAKFLHDFLICRFDFLTDTQTDRQIRLKPGTDTERQTARPDRESN